MSKKSIEVAIKVGKKMMSFNNLEEAEEYFFSYKDYLKKHLEEICLNNIELDYSLTSLKRIEQFYFELYEKDKFKKMSTTREEFEKMIGIYFGECAIKNKKNCRWFVEEYAFVKGKYSLYLKKGYGNFNYEMFSDLYKCPDNKSKTYVYRQYKRYID